MLEKILEEIEQKKERCLNIVKIEVEPMEITTHRERYKGLCMAEEIIRKHMNDGWIPVDEKMPEESEEFNDVYDPVTLAVIDTEWHEKSDIVQVTVYDRDEEKYFTYVDNTYNGEWVTFNLDNFKVIAWKPLSDPYRPEPLETRKELERSERK